VTLPEERAEAGRWRRRTFRVIGGIASAGAVAIAATAVLVPPPASAEGQPRPEADRVSSASRAARDGPITPPEAVGANPVGGSKPGPSALGPDPCRRRDGPARPIVLNSAGQAELEELPGIGPAKAQRILDWRARHGRFRRIVDLRRVKGFGRKTVLRLAPFLVLDRPPDTPVPSAAPIPPRPISSPSLILPAGLTSSPPPSLSPLPLPSVSSSPGKGGPSK